MKLRFLTPIALFAILIPLLIYGLSRDPGKVPSPFIGKPAPELELPDLENPGRVVSSADFAGRYALVNVWATWCVGCRHEHEFLLTLAKRGEIPIYGLNWKDDRNAALVWLRDLGDPYIATGFDADGRAGIDWGVYKAPETFLIGPDGTVLHKHEGPLTTQVWERDFVPLINGTKAD